MQNTVWLIRLGGCWLFGCWGSAAGAHGGSVLCPLLCENTEKNEHGGLEMALPALKLITKLGKGKSVPLFRILGLQVSHLIIWRGKIQGKDGAASPCTQLGSACAQHLLRRVFSVCSLLCVFGRLLLSTSITEVSRSREPGWFLHLHAGHTPRDTRMLHGRAGGLQGPAGPGTHTPCNTPGSSSPHKSLPSEPKPRSPGYKQCTNYMLIHPCDPFMLVSLNKPMWLLFPT